jgi:AcrR family transcriptional regulator
VSDKPKQLRGTAVRDKLVDIAANLFYTHGVQAVGVDEIARRSGMAKASLYRWFPGKEDLVLAVLQRRDDDFWAAWDHAAAQHADPLDELGAQLAWMQDLATQPNYRGCAFINTAAEFDTAQSAIRQRCLNHEEELHRRLRALTARLDTTDSQRLADQLHIAIVGTFATGGLYPTGGPAHQLCTIVATLVTAALAPRIERPTK